MDLPGLELTEVDRQVFLRCQPAPLRLPVDKAALLDLLVRLGYGQCLLLEDAIIAAANDCNTRQDAFEVKLAERRDSVIDIKIAADDMAAELSLLPPQGGAAASEEDVLRALSVAGVVSGIDSTAIVQACKTGSCSGLVVATGVAPVDGIDTVFELLIVQAVSREPKLDENGRIDYREHGAVASVHPGAPLMRRIPAKAGVDGYTVRAQVLVARLGREQPFNPHLIGAEVAGDDPNVLQAMVGGQPVQVNCGVMVESLLHLKEVNMATGNIHFDGTVEVIGDVNPGMKVQASGDIVVGGLVDGAQLEAGGDIRVAGGVIAHAKLHAGGAVSARFAQGVQIEAGTVIAINDMALECELASLNQIIIGAESSQRARLTGGVATAMMRLSVPVLGSAKGAVTKVVLGVNSELETRYAALQKRIEQEKATEANLEKLVKQLTATGDPKGMLERVKASRQHAVAAWGKSLAESSELEAEIALAAAARVDVTVGVAGAVDLSFGKLTARLRRDLDAGTFSVDADNRIAFTNVAGMVVPSI